MLIQIVISDNAIHSTMFLFKFIMNKSTFSSSVILASLLVFTVFFVEAAPVPGSLEPPPIPPNWFIPAIFSEDLLFSFLYNIQLVHITNIDITPPLIRVPANNVPASIDHMMGETLSDSAPIVLLRFLQKSIFLSFLAHKNIIIY